jgi:hypothetical protein
VRSSRAWRIVWVGLAVAVTLVVLIAGLTFCLSRDGQGKAGATMPAAASPPPSQIAMAPPPRTTGDAVIRQSDKGPAPKVLAAVPVDLPATTTEAPLLAPPVLEGLVPSEPSAPVTEPLLSRIPAESSPAKDLPPLALPAQVPPQLAMVPTKETPRLALPAQGGPKGKPAVAMGLPQERNAPTDTVTFFTSKAKGQRFCIIADCSGSMMGAPLLYLKQEMVKTLSSLKEESQFYVVFFSSQAIPMPSPGWVNGGKANVAKVLPWIQAMPALGGTQPLPAFMTAFQLKPRPDVIFFMTDGIIPVNVPEQVAALNQMEPRVVVNTIMFAHPNILGTGRPAPLIVLQPSLNLAANLLSRIAERSGGTYDLIKLGLP